MLSMVREGLSLKDDVGKFADLVEECKAVLWNITLAAQRF